MAATPTSTPWRHTITTILSRTLTPTQPPTAICFALRRWKSVEVEVAEEQPAFTYRRASPAERWPNSNKTTEEEEEMECFDDDVHHSSPIYTLMRDDKARDRAREREIFHHPQRDQTKRLKRMNKLALKKAVDWKERVHRLAVAICELEVARPVADVLESWPEQLNNEDLAMVLGYVGRENWRRALELYECLNLRKWYCPNTRMLATVLGVLGRANQVNVARELFLRAEPELTGVMCRCLMGSWACTQSKATGRRRSRSWS